MVKNLPASGGDVRDAGSTPGSGRSSGVGNGTLLQYSSLKHSMDRQRILAGYSPWGSTELDMTEPWSTHTRHEPPFPKQLTV